MNNNFINNGSNMENEQPNNTNFQNNNQVSNNINNYNNQTNKNNKDNKIIIIVISVIAVVILAIILGNLFGNKSNIDNGISDNGKSVYTISIDDFDANDDTFEKYVNKRITVTDAKVIDLDGLYFGPLPYRVECSNMDSLDVTEGDIVSITGILNEKTYNGLWYYMDDCSISK